MTATYNHNSELSDCDNPNYYVIHDTYTVKGNTYEITAHCNKMSDKGLHNLAKSILEIF